MAFEIEGVITQEEAEKHLSRLRAGRGGRKSKYSAVEPELEKLSDETPYVKVNGLKHTEVTGLRAYLTRNHQDAYRLRSAKNKQDDKYTAFISRKEKTKRGRRRGRKMKDE